MAELEQIRIRLVAADSGFLVELEDTSAPFGFDLDPTSATAELLVKIERNRCQLDDLREIGSRLWAGLLSPALRTRVQERIRAASQSKRLICLELQVPTALEALPWEAAHEVRGDTFLSAIAEIAIVRRYDAGEPPNPLPQAADLNLLVVVPQGSGLDVEREWKNIRDIWVAAGSRRPPVRIEGRVTRDALDNALERIRPNIVHFVGHGEQDPRASAMIRLNSESGEDDWIPADQFALCFKNRNVALAVLNCCFSAAPAKRAGLSALGPMLLFRGVGAVVAMRYEIADDLAIKFSRRLYERLLVGSDAGNLLPAVESAREKLYLNAGDSTARAFVTPVVFMGNAGTRLFRGSLGVAPRMTPVPRAAPATTSLDPRLIQALVKRRCIPVIGPGVLAAGMSRGPNPEGAPTVLALARRIASKCNFPDLDSELRAAELTGTDTVALQRVAQHFEYKCDRPDLIDEINEAYRAAVPHALFEMLSNWDVPGIIYVHFDGLLERALEQRNRAFRVLNYVERGAGAAVSNVSLLVHLRGSITDFRSLVVTEADHDTLLDRLSTLAPEVAGLVSSQPGRSLLFLGVSPRDLVVKRLVAHLLPQAVLQTAGPRFFVCPRRSPVDEAAWRQFTVQWVEQDLDQAISSLTAAVSK